jgi:drug/metabolite transporter (DMT)-like permease
LPTPIARGFRFLTGNAYIMLSLTTVLWAMNTVAARLAVGNVSPMLLVLLRWVLACAILVVIAREALRADWPLLKNHLVFIFVMGAFGYTGFNALFYAAGHHTTAINIGILQGSMPVLVLIVGVILLRENARPIQWFGTAVTLLGVALVASGGDLTRLASLTFNIGDIWLLIACVFYSTYTVGLRYYAKPAALSGSNTTNWLTDNYPQLYLYGALKAAAIYVSDDAALAKYSALFDKALIDLEGMDDFEKYGPAPVVSSETYKW